MVFIELMDRKMKLLRNLFTRTWNAIKVFYMVWKNPSPINETVFRLNQSLLEFFIRVQEENRPYFTQFGFVHPDDGNKPIVTVWAAPGSNSNPEKRIKELIEENQNLRAQIDRMMIKEKP